MKGDIIDYNNSDKILKLKPGSVIKIIGVSILSKDINRLGIFWYNQLHYYKFEIIKEV